MRGLIVLSLVSLLHIHDLRAQESLVQAGTLEAAIIREQNFARTNPHAYAEILDSTRAYYSGKMLRRPGAVAEVTREGVAAVDEAVSFLRAIDPVPPLGFSRGLSMGARDHVRDQGPRGLVGHVGTDSSMVWDRVNRYGRWSGSVAENIAYGPDFITVTARTVVMQLIIDDGVTDRGHRTAMFDASFKYGGVACGVHLGYRKMCVLTYALVYEEM